MALTPRYAVREVVTSFRRNMLMTMAAMLTMWVSLTMFGGARLINQASRDASVQWRGGVELNIFLRTDVTASQVDSIGRELTNMPQVKKHSFVDQQGAYAEFKTLFSNQPVYLENVQPTDLPPSYRVVPKKAESVTSIGDHFKGFPGVYQVAYAKEYINKVLQQTKRQETVLLVISGAVLLAAVVLTFTTIQLAIFSRRREVAVMKLVGATNWFIRVPFMLEGLLEGLIGGALAFATIYVFRSGFAGVGTQTFVGQSNTLHVTSTEAIKTGVILIVAGAAMGVIGSAIAVRRFLTV